MGWLRAFLLGDIGNHLDILDTERKAAQSFRGIHRVLRSKSRRDRSQDERIAALELENQELEVTVAALVRMLHDKNIVRRDELESLATAIEGEMEREKQRALQEEEQSRAREAPLHSRKKKTRPR